MRFRTMRHGAAIIATVAFGWIGFAQAQDNQPAPAAAAPAAEAPAPAEPELPPEAAKGRYLATVGNCHTCHTVEGGKPFTGGVSFPTDFGTIYSTNITQDAETGIGKWSLDDFKKAMRTGVRPDGVHLYPAFPYTSFTLTTDEDLAALYAYMKTLAPVSAPAKANEMKFPFNQRSLMSFWNKLFLKEGAYQAQANQSAEFNRGAYLVEGLGHCSSCHSPRNFLGAERTDVALAGGVYKDKNRKGNYVPWSAVNLTSANVGLAAWSADDLHAYLKNGVSKRATTYGPMNDVIMNSTSKLTEDDLKAVVTYIKALPPKTIGSGSAASKQTMNAGETVYTVHCGTCHLPTGLGADGLGTPLVGSAVINTPDPATLITTILYGPQLPPPPFVSGRRMMLPLADELSDEEVAQVSSYVRATWGNSAGGVTAEQVAKQR